MAKYMKLTMNVLLATMLLPSLGNAATIDVVKRIENKVDTVSARTANISNQTTKLLERIPDNAEIRELTSRLAVEKVQVILDLVNKGVSRQEILNALQVQQAGFEDWKSSGGPGRMQEDLVGVLDGIVTLADTTQRLRCYQNPNANIIPISANASRKAIAVLPDLLLYGMERILDDTIEDWRSSIEEMNKSIPDGLVQDICEYGDIANDVSDTFEVAKCDILTTIPWSSVHKLKKAKLQAGRVHKKFNAVAKLEPDNLIIGAALNVEAGAGAAIDSPNPNKALLTKWAVRTKEFSDRVASVLETRAACIKEDLEIEADLLSCSLRAKYISTPIAAQAYFARTLLDAEGFDMNFRQLCTSYQVKICELHQFSNPDSKCIYKGWRGPDV